MKTSMHMEWLVLDNFLLHELVIFGNKIFSYKNIYVFDYLSSLVVTDLCIVSVLF